MSCKLNQDDTFEILIASDIHLGYNEKDPIRGNDSFNTFEEILQIAVDKNVDFILLGGDLFHESRPSAQCLHRCLSLLRTYCMGDKPISVEFLSNQGEIFKHCTHPVVNYEDPNLNVSIPVYSIHGNHDDPSGFGRMSALDLISVSGLINYFGKWSNVIDVSINPILLKKGKTRLGIYGLSHIRDERLSRLFKNRKVKAVVPPDAERYVNLFVLHQNRAENRGETNYIKESMLPDFVDLVVWGHEHECRIDPEWNDEKQFYVTQPGSPVATSLCEGEAVAKHVGLLRVNDKKFNLSPVALQTVRPIVFDSIKLSESSVDKKKPSEVIAYLMERVESLLVSARSQETGHPKQPKLPLMRIRVEYNQDNQCFNTIRFGQKFAERIANHSDMVKLTREASKTRRKKEEYVDKEALNNALEEEMDVEEEDVNIECVLREYFKNADPKKQLKVLSVKGLAQAVSKFIDSSDKEALEVIAQHQMKKTIEHLRKQEVDVDNIEQHVEEFRRMRLAKYEEEALEVEKALDTSSRAEFDSTLVSNTSSVATKRGRGRGSRGRRASGSRSTTLSSTRSSDKMSDLSSFFQPSQVSVSSGTPAKRRKIAFDSDSD